MFHAASCHAVGKKKRPAETAVKSREQVGEEAEGRQTMVPGMSKFSPPP